METSTTSINASEGRLSSPPHPPVTLAGDPSQGELHTSSQHSSLTNTAISLEDMPLATAIYGNTPLILAPIPENSFLEYWRVKAKQTISNPQASLRKENICKKSIALKNCYKEIKSLRSGDLSVKVSSLIMAQRLQQVSKIGETFVEVSQDIYLNSSKGIVSSFEFQDLSDSELTHLFSSISYTVKRMPGKRDEKGNPTFSNTLLITFKSPSLPTSIKIGYMTFRVKPFFPNPTRCYNCNLYGHTNHNCKKSKRCGWCGQEDDDHPARCNNQKFCFHCTGEHPVWDRECPKLEREKELVKILSQEKLTRREGIKKWETDHFPLLFQELSKKEYAKAAATESRGGFRGRGGRGRGGSTRGVAPRTDAPHQDSPRATDHSNSSKQTSNSNIIPSVSATSSVNKNLHPTSSSTESKNDSKSPPKKTVQTTGSKSKSSTVSSKPVLKSPGRSKSNEFKSPSRSKTKSAESTSATPSTISVSNSFSVLQDVGEGTEHMDVSVERKKRSRSETSSNSSPTKDREAKFNRFARSDQTLIGNTIYFLGAGSPFSNFHNCKIIMQANCVGPIEVLPKRYQGQTTITLDDAETLYQHRKSWAFNDPEMCKKILDIRNPKDVKKASYQIKGYRQGAPQQKWHNSLAVKVMCECVYRKFEDNSQLKEHLMQAPEHLIEASADKFWGSGTYEHGEVRGGANMLGQILVALRDFYSDNTSPDPYNFKTIKQHVDSLDPVYFQVVLDS